METQKKYYPLTHPQRGIWFTEKLYSGTSIGNIAATLRIKGDLDYSLLEKAVNILLERNDSIRLRIVEENGEPKQYVSEYKYKKLDLYDFSELGLEGLYKWDAEQTRIPYSLIDSDLYYFALIKLNDHEGGVFTKIHHIISDAWTVVQIGNQILEYYRDLKNGIEVSRDKKPSYIEYIQSEQEYKNSKRFLKDKEYWNERFRDVPELTTLKTRKSNFASTKARRKTFVISEDLTAKIREYCSKSRSSIFAIFLSTLAIYINRMTSKTDMVFGTPVLNRSNAREKETLGMFISTAPIRIKVKDDMDFTSFTQLVTKEWMSILRHQRYPYDMLLKDIRKRYKNRDNLYDIFLSYQNAKFVKQHDKEQHEGRWHFNGHQVDPLYIHINDREDEGNLILDYDYQEQIYSIKEIEYIHKHLLNIIQDAVDNPEKKLYELELLVAEEKERILYKFNNTKTDYPKNKTVYQLFEEQAERSPDKVAVEQLGREYSYDYLNRKANQLAWKLTEKGIKKGDFVVILMERSFETIAAILAVMKSGAAYIPIDPGYPEDRISYLLNDSKSTAILVQKNLVQKIPGDCNQTIIEIEPDLDLSGFPQENLKIANSPDDLAYIIYTSGSTGNPKGAMITHKGLTNYITWANKVYVQGERVNFPLYSSLSFDLTVTSIFTPLISGNKIVIYKEESPETLVKRVFRENKVHIVKLTPSHLNFVKDIDNSNSSIRRLIVGGEDLKTELAKTVYLSFKGNVEIFNEYGPTETVVGCMIYKYNYQKDTAVSVPIGVPADNVRIYILDKHLNPVPIGIPGEIYIGGDGVAKGYLNNPELTSQKFIDDPFVPGEKLYRTGDLARWYPKGDIEFLGRTDYQIKIKGYRIELGEIESHLMNHKYINEAVVLDRKDKNGRTYLCAYVVFNKGKKLSVVEIRAYLSKKLPNYMIPSRFLELEKIPLTPNGKIDRRALLGQGKVVDTGVKYIEPRNEVEKKLAEVWSEVLGIERIGLNDNFFDLGGDSLSILQVQTALLPYNWDLKTQDFYKYPTISELSDKIRGIVKEDNRLQNYKLDISKPKIDSLTPPSGFNSGRIHIKKVFLTGATGFLGIHLLDELLSYTDADVFCLVRGKGISAAKERLINTLDFYFDDKHKKQIGKRIFVVNGDITLKRFGLSDEEYSKLGKEIDTVIHSAALVKHYGEYEDFEKANVLGTKHIIDFSRTYNKHLNHISTLSVSGNYLVEQSEDNLLFTENDFYINQKFADNAYIKGKFEAENLVFKSVESGLEATIFRIGVLTGRYSDGHFQVNIRNNAFYNKIKSIIELKAVPEELLEQDIEFTPVDLCSKAVVELVRFEKAKNRVFHVLNNNYIKTSDMIDILNKLGIEIKVMDNNSFKEHVELVSMSPEMREVLLGIINDFSENRELSYRSSVTIDSSLTNECLRQLKFKWPKIDSEYIRKVITYMAKVSFLQGITSLGSEHVEKK